MSNCAQVISRTNRTLRSKVRLCALSRNVMVFFCHVRLLLKSVKLFDVRIAGLLKTHGIRMWMITFVK